MNKNGLIDGQYRYLYYECRVANRFQRERGWIVKREDLLSFFEENLKQYGFIRPEIDDFIDYWIPRLNTEKEYLLFPQTAKEISGIIELDFSKQPQSLLRLFYVIKENYPQIKRLKKPQIPIFKHRAYSVVEWGVLRTENSP